MLEKSLTPTFIPKTNFMSNTKAFLRTTKIRNNPRNEIKKMNQTMMEPKIQNFYLINQSKSEDTDSIQDHKAIKQKRSLQKEFREAKSLSISNLIEKKTTIEKGLSALPL